MTCTPFRQSIFLHAHGQLGRAQSWFVERHLACCPACREEWQRASREAAELRGLFAPPTGAAKSMRLTPTQLLAARGERLVNRGRATEVESSSWLPAGWAQHLGRSFEGGAGRGSARWLALLVVAALLASGLAAAATLGPPSNFVRRCLGWSNGEGSGACALPSSTGAPGAPQAIPMSPPPESGIKLPAGVTPAPACPPPGKPNP